MLSHVLIFTLITGIHLYLFDIELSLHMLTNRLECLQKYRHKHKASEERRAYSTNSKYDLILACTSTLGSYVFAVISMSNVMQTTKSRLT